MKVFIILAHPERQSFNGAMFDRAVETLTTNGHQVVTSDLYRMGFQAVSDRSNFLSQADPHYFRQQTEERLASEQGSFSPEIEAELQKLESCDLMIWQFPLWWFSLPAILKGWVDRVLVMGRTYGGGKMYDQGVFRGKRALLSLTTGGPSEAYSADGMNGDLRSILRPIHRGILQFVGFSVLEPHVTYGPVRVDEATRTRWLNRWAERLDTLQHESPIEVGKY